jgi:hypothetical protein
MIYTMLCRKLKIEQRESHKKPESRFYITYIVITTCTWVYFRETNFLLYYEKKVSMLFINKICLDERST